MTSISKRTLCDKRKKSTGYQAFSPFATMFSNDLFYEGCQYLRLCGKGLFIRVHVRLSKTFFNPFPDDKILEWSKLKQIADDILKSIKNEK